MPSGPQPPFSLDALVAAAEIDAAAGVQVVPASEAGRADASMAVVVVTGGEADPSPLLAKYPGSTPVTLVMHDSEGGVERGALLTVAVLREERCWEHSGVAGLGLPPLAPAEVRNDLRGLVGVIRRLRDPKDGCPWDIEQDHLSLRPHLLEESYEVLEALDALAGAGAGAGEVAGLREELGDLLMQIVLQARVAEQAGEFTLGEVAEGIREKLVRRHPHVFGDVEAETAAEVARNWEQLKAVERKADGALRESALDGVPRALPALSRAQTLVGRASRRGFAWESEGDVLAKLEEELQEIAAAPAGERAGEVGDLLFVVCDYLRRQGVEAEDALREACGKFERRFRALEAGLRAEGVGMEGLGQGALLARWDRVKAESG